MKKLTTLFAALFLIIGMAQAQDVYFSGNHNGTGKIWKNNALVQSTSDTTFSVSLTALQVANDSSLYCAGYVHDSTYGFVQGRIWLNDSLVFNADTNTTIRRFVINGSQWTAAGYGANEWENVAGLVWQDGELLYAYSDSTHNNRINALTFDTVTGDLYAAGISAELESRATVWKNDTLFWREDSVSVINDIIHNGTDLFAAGCRYLGDTSIFATLWKNDTVFFCINDASAESEFQAVAFYNGSVYIGGYNGNTLYIWQDDEVLYDHPYTNNSKINALVVNESGVYYAGQIDGVATVWKDGEILYQPEDCEDITSLVVVLPSPPLPMYTLTVEADTTGWGTVSGGGDYPLGDTVTIEAFPILGCEFLFWNDSITDNPRDIVVTQDSTFIAYFGRLEYLITTEVNPEGSGTVTGGGTYYYNDTIPIEAVPNLGFEFIGWNDSITDNPRNIIITQDSTFTALFDTLRCTVTTAVIPENAGTVSGGGIFNYGTTISLEATPNTGYVFAHWGDGETANPRTVLVEGDTTYTALFEALEYEITTIAQPAEGGTVIGGGVYPYGTEVTLTARPNDNYEFVCWSDGIVSNPRYITVTQDASYTALFSSQGPQNYTITVLANEPELGTVEGSGT